MEMQRIQNNDLDIKTNAELLEEEVDTELSDQFSFDGFQVVRGEFFSHLREPSITLADCKIYANAAAVNKMPDFDYVQIMVHSQDKKIAIKPCDEDAKDAFLWRRYNEKKGRYQPRTITCRVFYAKIIQLTGWNPNNRHKMMGKLIKSNGEYLFLFDLTAVETYERIVREGSKPYRSRTPIYPAEWQNQFGLSVEEHSKQLQVNIFDGYTVFDITHKKHKQKEEEVWQEPVDQPYQSIQEPTL